MAQGEFRIYLGAAPGVGKTYAMLNEGWRRRDRGTDVVIGVVETHGRQHTLAQLHDLEVIPRRVVDHRGAQLSEMDVEAILARRPDVCLVDELAHTNAPGGAHEKRWQDVEQLLGAGIDVISTVNIQHLESLHDVVERITGIAQQETVPDAFVRRADQIELVDISPEALRRRLAHGNVYPAERIDAALANYFRPGNLSALRELALLWVADRVEEGLSSYLNAHGIHDAWETRERIVVAVTGAPSSDDLIRRGSRIATRAHGELVAVHVAPPQDGQVLAATSTALEQRRRLVTELGGTYHEIVADDPAAAMIAFAQTEKATQLVVGSPSPRKRWQRQHFTQQIAGMASGIDVHIVATDDPEPDAKTTLRRTRVDLGRRRLAWVVALVGIPALTAVLVTLRDHVSLPTALLGYLALVVTIASIGGRRVSLFAAAAAALLENWFFVEPLHTLNISEADDALAIAIFVLVAGVTGTMVEHAIRERNDARRARAEVEALARSTTALAIDTDPLPQLLRNLRATFDLRSVALTEAAEAGWQTLAAEPGDDRLPNPQHQQSDQHGDGGSASDEVTLDLPNDGGGPALRLTLTGRELSADDRRILAVLSGQIAIAVDSQRRRNDAQLLDQLTALDVSRTALLRAVSHDLRTPLAAIKTHASGLLADDVKWSEHDYRVGLHEIDAAADHLDSLVGDLLDASRLEAGETLVRIQDTDIREIIESVVGRANGAIVCDVPPTLPLVSADPVLLERCVENLLANAIRHGRSEHGIRIDARVVHDHIHVRVVDRGVGIQRKDQEQVLLPFHRLGDQHRVDGAGLGLAITHGFLTAMRAELLLEDTPGGGLTATVVVATASPQIVEGQFRDVAL